MNPLAGSVLGDSTASIRSRPPSRVCTIAHVNTGDSPIAFLSSSAPCTSSPDIPESRVWPRVGHEGRCRRRRRNRRRHRRGPPRGGPRGHGGGWRAGRVRAVVCRVNAKHCGVLTKHIRLERVGGDSQWYPYDGRRTRIGCRHLLRLEAVMCQGPCRHQNLNRRLIDTNFGRCLARCGRCLRAKRGWICA